MNDKHGSRWGLILLTCILAVPTVGLLMGLYPGEPDLRAMAPALLTGAVLGVAHLILRPVLRLFFSPLGCLTLGLFGLVIDLALIYLSAAFVEGFTVPGLPFALSTALLVNLICAVAAGRKH